MSAEIISHFDGIVTAKITGKLTQPELTTLQQSMLGIIGREGGIRALTVCEDFQGGAKEGEREDVSFQNNSDPYINKMALVCDRKWEDLALIFSGKGFREFISNRATSIKHKLGYINFTLKVKNRAGTVACWTGVGSKDAAVEPTRTYLRRPVRRGTVPSCTTFICRGDRPAFMNVTLKVMVGATHSPDSQGHHRDCASLLRDYLSFAGMTHLFHDR
ncbi:STAS/SEC14 domain-containing protein [Methylomonas sp. SURF-2]|uniref:STAS/SEC14 domain-containing protein n=1 Tax=Methylomonas subterranea TaxID=2952225 RepID=A0ABT1TBE0_9GAMM|nr:STAS/SEC14 domain-containing protein [Methylomonas sp. SURF-2]MCQ8102588.1 STAS/SEC14 domain-containing protein [Methylomonas sp. SURF-2]